MIMAALALLLALTLPIPNPPQPLVEPPQPSAKPNILVIYIDDAAPHDARLWSNPAVTPTITGQVVNQGISFSNAIVEDPLCCPARGNLLTGLHTHNNGVNTNDIRLFDPGAHLGRAMHDAGYTSIWAGKYLNRPYTLSPNAWAPHYAAWDRLDVTFGTNNRVQTRTGNLYFPGLHATTIVGNRVAQHIREAPADKPVFAVMSIFNLHSPNKAVAQTPERLALCDSVGSWNPPNFNEADVSDKPAYIRNRPLLTQVGGWPLKKYCREMLGIDDSVRTVVNELEAQGRLDNTLIVFTADNGMAWGAHRLPQLKQTPYATPVPLYMAWPAAWGNAPRVIDEHVSNIDLAPTLCEIAGCTLGPYPTGQDAPDGVSLLGLIEHGTSLGRDALLETSPVGDIWAPAWHALRTTAINPLGLWHYVEYATGELELYNLAADPYELQNLAADVVHAPVVEALALRLDQLREEGRVNKPDLRGAVMPNTYGGHYIGYNLFNDQPTARQAVVRTGAQRNTYYTYDVELENNSLTPDSFTVKATITGTERMLVRILVDGTDITADVTGSGYVIDQLGGEQVRHMTVEVYVKPFARASRKFVVMTATSTSFPERSDTITVVTRR